MTVTVAGGSFDLPRAAAKSKQPARKAPAPKQGAPKDTSTRDKWVRYGIGVSIAGVLAADAIVLNGMLSKKAADIFLDPPRVETAAPASATSTPAGQGFAGLNVPADRALGASGRTFSKWTSPASFSTANSAEAPAFAVTTAPGLSLPTGGLPSFTGEPGHGTGANPGTNGGDETGGDTGGDNGLPTPPPEVQQPVATVVDTLIATVKDVPFVGNQVAPIIEDAIAPTPVESTVQTVADSAPTSTEPTSAPTSEPSVIEPIVEPVTSAVPTVPGL